MSFIKAGAFVVAGTHREPASGQVIIGSEIIQAICIANVVRIYVPANPIGQAATAAVAFGVISMVNEVIVGVAAAVRSIRWVAEQQVAVVWSRSSIGIGYCSLRTVRAAYSDEKDNENNAQNNDEKRIVIFWANIHKATIFRE